MSPATSLPFPIPNSDKPEAEGVPVTLRHFATGAVSDAELEPDLTVEAATRVLVSGLELPELDAGGRAQRYELFVRRADGGAQHLPASARIGDVVDRHAELEPMPEVVPGGGAAAR
jgi:hypothetical protein